MIHSPEAFRGLLVTTFHAHPFFIVKMQQEVVCLYSLTPESAKKKIYLHCKERYLLGCVCVCLALQITTSEKQQLHGSLYMGPPSHSKRAHKPAQSEQVLMVGWLII